MIMRKLLFLFFLLVNININAQNFKSDGKPYEVYCQIYGQLQASGKILYKRILWPEFDSRTKLTDEKGNKLEFNNVLEAMNYLSKRGWTYVGNNTYHDMIFYTLKKIVLNDQEAREGLHFKEDFK